MFVNKTTFGQVLRIYANLSKNYKHFVTGKLIYFWKQDGKYLRNVFVPWIPLSGKFKQFLIKQVSAIAPQNSSCFTSLILVNLVQLVWVLVTNGNVSIVKSVLSHLFMWCSAVYYFWLFTICPLPFCHK